MKRLPYLRAQVLTNDDGDSLIALDNHIEMMIKRTTHLITRLRKYGSRNYKQGIGHCRQ